MFYEGTEKRLFINVNSINLLEIEQVFWQQLVAETGAAILSCLTTSHVTAYLLSESSLLIWKDKLLLITCGNTQLINAACFFQRHIAKEHISRLIFHRHNALKPHLQATSFEQDLLQLKKHFNGQKHALWRDSSGHAFIYSRSMRFPDLSQEMPQRIDMFHGLQGEWITRLQSQHIAKSRLLETLQLTRFFGNLHIDHHSFNPKGYSLNAVTGQDYLTLHLTPETLSTYLSVETSLIGPEFEAFITHLHLLFSPQKHTTLDAHLYSHLKVNAPEEKSYQHDH